MDLNTVTELHRPTGRADLTARLVDGATAPLAGGTWLFSQPQPLLRALVDLTGLAWTPIVEDVDGV
ncbi:MAG TPA: FAD-binding molybdopterin dehydrogenase, partial [Pseudonocardia sp.]